MRAATSSRRGPSHRDTFHTTAPIPIPSHRRAADTHDEASSPELIFHMSPDVSDETPLAQINTSYILNETGTRLNQRSSFMFAGRFGHVKSPSVDLPPYYDEPFMYSIPRIPARPPPSHARTRSEIVAVPKATSNEMKCDTDLTHRSIFSASPSSLASSFPSNVNRTSCSAISEVAYDASNPLTSAFQKSLSYTTSGSPLSDPSASLDGALFTHPISPPASIRGWKGSSRPARSSPLRQRKILDTAAGINGLTRSSAAQPVVSFAQAGLNQSLVLERLSRGGKGSRNRQSSPMRARSPYPVQRGRRKSPLRSQLKVSDEDLAGTLDNMDFSEKFGLEKFLAPECTKRKGSDENVPQDEAVERGRTRSRARGGRRG